MRFDDDQGDKSLPETSDHGRAEKRVALASNAFGQVQGGSPVRIVPGPDGVVTLPAGVDLDDVQVVGRDLVVTLPDGTQWIIVDGAVFVPQLVLGDVQVPPTNLAALLIGQEPQPAAGLPQSSGGNFAVPVGNIGDPFALGDLLPPTDLSFQRPEREEIYQPLPEDDEPGVIIITPDDPTGAVAATVTVNEAGLPARGSEPPGSNASANSETATGTIEITSGDAPFTVTINGVTVSAVGQTFNSPSGTLTITSIGETTIGFSYTLTDNLLNGSEDSFAVTIADADGDTASGTVMVNVIDDVPTARADTDSVGDDGSATGNVVTGADTTSGAGGADTQGADGATLTGVRPGDAGGFTAVGGGGATVQGQYGTLTIAADGSYTYTRADGTPGGATDVFTYQLTDGDGDTSTATLTIDNPDSPVTLEVPTVGDGTIVDEAGLPERGSEPPGSDSASDSESTSGTITYTAPDGPATVTVAGTTVTGVGQVIAVPGGTLTVTSVAPGEIGYTFTLADNAAADPASVDIPVTVTDSDGDSADATLTITIVDDVPTAVDDSAAPAEDAPVLVDVFANDTPGADGVDLATGVALGDAPALGTAVYNGDGTFTYTPNPGAEGSDSFTYTITDGDGDTSTATVTITLATDSTPTVDVVPSTPNAAGNSEVEEAGLPARGGEPAGSDAPANSETTTGTLAIATGNDSVASLVIGGVDVTAGGTVTGAHGTLTVTLNAGVYSYSYTLTDNTAGDATNDSFTVTVTDSDGDTASDALVIDIVDDVPTAADDSAAPAEDAAVVVDVFANDVSGADGVDLATGVALGDAPALGTAVYNGDGTFTYTPNAGAEGSDSFTYTITDGDGDTSTATVTITLAADSTPTVDVGAANAVEEAGLPAGSDPAADSETATGNFAIATGNDSVGSLVVNGTDVTGGGTVAGAFGTLTVSLNAGVYSYSYTLTTNTSGDATSDSFTVTVTDSDGDPASDTLVIDIVDDVPTARNDADSVTEDGPLVADGNVLTGSGGDDANGTDGVADTPGADGAQVSTTGSFTGQYGTLVLNADGSYSYTLDNGNTAVQGLSAGETLSETFNYTITDGDGDPSSATLTITIDGADDGVTITGLDAAGAEEVVNEDDLADGSSPDAAALTQGGTFDVSTPDGLNNVTIGGTQVVAGGVFTAGLTATSALGTVTITGFTPVLGDDGSVIGGTFTYSYTLDDNTLTHPAAGEDSVTDSFAVTVTDSDGSTGNASLDVQVIDDVPTAEDDAAGLTEGGPSSVTFDVDANDTPGADGTGSRTFTTLTGTYGDLTINGDGTQTYTLNAAGQTAIAALSPGETLTDSFGYTLTDGDGDADTANLTVTLTGADDPVVITGLTPAASGGDATVDEDDLPGGTDTSPESLTVGGTFTISAPDGLDDLTVGTQPVITDGVFTATSFTTPLGNTLAITNYDPATGLVTYTYTLSGAEDHAAGGGQNSLFEDFTVTLTDTDGSSASDTLSINIVDDVPGAVADTNSVTEGGVVGGNVLTNDVLGADGAAPGGAVTGVVAGSNTGTPVSGGVGTPVAGTYGTLTLNANGTYSYDGAPNAVPPAGATDTFVYTITDGDGDTSTVTLTINLTDSGLAAVNEDAVVNEAALATGSNPSSTAETATGTVADNVSGGSGPFTFALVGGGAGNHGTLTLNPNGSWSYTLATPVDGSTADNGANTVDNVETFTYQVTDANGNTTTNTLTIDVIDDVPAAVADTNSVTEGGVVGGNVLTDGVDDVLGADGAAPGGAVTGVAAGSNTSSPVAGGIGVPVAGTYGTLTLNANGTYSYDGAPNAVPPAGATDTFVYTITDGDGDTSTVTLTINLTDSGLTAVNEDAVVNEAALATGSNPSSTAETATGTVADNVSGGSGPFTFALVGGGAGNHGTLTLNPNGSWSYTLATPVDGSTADNGANTVDNVETFTYQVTDANGNTTTNTLTIDVIDDVPTANPDADSVTEDTALVADGNVLTGVGGGTADVQGADGAVVTGVAAGTPASASGSVGSSVAGSYGAIAIGADGAYTYTLNNGNAAVQALSTGQTLTDTFTYTITDGDGDPTTTTVTITINGSNDTPTVTVPTAGGPGTQVSEAGLPARGSEPAGSASAGSSETTTGSFSYTNGDGASTVTVNNVAIAVGATVAGDYGTLTITSIVGNTVNYSYTLADNVDHDSDATPFESFTVVVADSDGNPADDASGTFQINIADDAPSLTSAEDLSIPNAVGSETGDLGFAYGADGGAITLTALTSIPGITYQGNGTGTITALVDGNPYFTVTVNQQTGEYTVDVLTERPVVETPLQISTLAPGNYETISVGGATFDGVSFANGTTLPSQFTNDTSSINPSGNGFGIANNLVNDNEGFLFTNDNSQALSFNVNFQSNTSAVTISYSYFDGTNWVDVAPVVVNNPAGPNDIASVTLDPGVSWDQIVVRFDYTGNGQARVQDFVVTEQVIPDDQVISFGVTVTDNDGDTVSSSGPPTTIDLTFLGGAPGGSSFAATMDSESKLAAQTASMQVTAGALAAAGVAAVILPTVDHAHAAAGPAALDVANTLDHADVRAFETVRPGLDTADARLEGASVGKAVEPETARAPAAHAEVEGHQRFEGVGDAAERVAAVDHSAGDDHAGPAHAAANLAGAIQLAPLVEAAALPAMAERAQGAVAGPQQAELRAVLADALPQGGHGPDIDALLSHLPAAPGGGGGGGAIDAGPAAAQVAIAATADWQALAFHQMPDMTALSHDAVMATTHA